MRSCHNAARRNRYPSTPASVATKPDLHSTPQHSTTQHAAQHNTMLPTTHSIIAVSVSQQLRRCQHFDYRSSACCAHTAQATTSKRQVVLHYCTLGKKTRRQLRATTKEGTGANRPQHYSCNLNPASPASPACTSCCLKSSSEAASSNTCCHRQHHAHSLWNPARPQQGNWVEPTGVLESPQYEQTRVCT